MALKKSKLSQIPERNKDLAFGYVKQCEQTNKTSIPEMIKYLCLVYLNQNKDKIDLQRSHQDFKMDGDQLQIKKKICRRANAYFENIAWKGIHIWKFKLVNISFSDLIGIVDVNLTKPWFFRSPRN